MSRPCRVLSFDDVVVRRVLYSENVESELSTDQKGAIAEACISATAIKLGLGVFRPLSDGERYDLILNLRPRLLRVQCRTAVLHADVLAVPFYSNRRCSSGFRKLPYTSDEIDAVAAYSPELDRCFLLPMTQFGTRTYVQLRLAPSKNNQRARINWGCRLRVRGYTEAPRGRSSAGRAFGWHPKGQGFDPPRLHSPRRPPPRRWLRSRALEEQRSPLMRVEVTRGDRIGADALEIPPRSDG